MRDQALFDKIDLHLIRVLHTVLTERSVSKAAMKLGMYQPAVSASLKRLRELAGDPLVVRSGAGMVPTDAGLRMIEPSASILRAAEMLFSEARGFEAQTATFVTDVRDGFVCFAYQGQRTAEIARDITLEHAAWFYDIGRRLSEPALRDGLLACGATPEEATRFARALRDRIRQIGEACGEATRATRDTETVGHEAHKG